MRGDKSKENPKTETGTYVRPVRTRETGECTCSLRAITPGQWQWRRKVTLPSCCHSCSDRHRLPWTQVLATALFHFGNSETLLKPATPDLTNTAYPSTMTRLWGFSVESPNKGFLPRIHAKSLPNVDVDLLLLKYTQPSYKFKMGSATAQTHNKRCLAL